MEFDCYSFIVKPKLLMYYFHYGRLILSLSRVGMVAPICCSFYVTGIFCMVFTVLYYCPIMVLLLITVFIILL
jgi:hypothetical protein